MNTASPSDGTMTALTKLSMSIAKQQEAAIKMQEDKSDNMLKSWRRLPKIQQNIILQGGIDSNGEIPTEPTEEMLSTLGCQNGAQVDQYLRQSMAGHNLHLEPGLCSAINKGIFAHPDDMSTPRNFAAFLTPPINDDDDIMENSNLLKLAVQDKYDSHDVTLLTKTDISIPMEDPELKHEIKNIEGLSGRTLG